MHNAAFEALEADARYELRDVEPEDLAAEVQALRGSDRIGANVTKPYKMAVCDLVDELGPEVERLGAANTIVRYGDRLVAHNTDLAALRDELPPGIRRAVVLGAGGASRAAFDALTAAGCQGIVVIDRARWANLAGALVTADLLVNATPIGTDSDETPVPASFLRRELAVLDLVYRPSPSRLVREARAAGARARGGAGMLLRQAALSFSIWADRNAPIEVMREALRRELGPGADV
ncbi:MAG: shikimate dehydrogenase [Chloroflexi bacterium]|nr:shikimate dehydrogenase [Chloroflexota bacterium]